jgi:putative hydrolase of the HAD superfamily
MDILGIRDCFEGMIDIITMDPLCKPQEDAYRFALNHVGADDPTRCIMLDDSIRNLNPAKTLGMFTILIGSNGSQPGIDRTLEDIHDLPSLASELWVG